MKWLLCAALAAVVISVMADWKEDKAMKKLPATGEICGSDGVVYPNKCAFVEQQCKNDKTLEWRPTKFCSVPSNASPNDDSDKKSGRHNEKGKKGGKKGQKERFATLCASNGQTYEDSCAFKLATCADKTLKVAFVGKCGDCSAENVCAKNDQSKPKYVRGKPKKICGTDRKQYDNYCDFKKARCQLLKDGGAFLEMAKCKV